MKKILVTAIGGDISQSISLCLKDYKGGIYLVGADTHTKHAGSLYADKFISVPLATSSNYFQTVSNVVKQEKIDATIPVNENEIKLLANINHDIKTIHCQKEILNTGLDKLATIKSLKKLGIEVPWTIDADNEIPNDFPCIMKPRFSSGSRSIFIVKSTTEAKFFSKKYPGCVFQELLEPYEKEVTCCLYRTKDGSIGSIQFERLLTGGLTGWGRVINNKLVKELLEYIANGWNLHGSINIQLRITKKGPMVFEINPRFSSTAYMRHKLGFTDVLWSLKEFFDEPIELTNVKTGSICVRKQDVVIL